MKAGDVRAKTDDELTGQLDLLGKEIFNLRFQRANGQLENTARFRQVRRDIARIKTIQGERAPPGELGKRQNVQTRAPAGSSSATRATRR